MERTTRLVLLGAFVSLFFILPIGPAVAKDCRRSANVNIICTGYDCCEYIIHSERAHWCEGNDGCVGRRDCHFHDLVWCGHMSVCDYSRSEWGFAPCGMYNGRCWQHCWDYWWHPWDMGRMGCFPDGWNLEDCHYTITTCWC